MNQKLGAVSRDRGQSRAGTATRNVVLVTGGSRGLGAELVSGFLARRYAVATLSRTKTAFIEQTLQGPRKKEFCWSAMDARDGEALRGYVTKVAERLAGSTSSSTTWAWRSRAFCRPCGHRISAKPWR